MLTVSHAAGANEPAVRDITLGELLQWAAETAPDRIALIAASPTRKIAGNGPTRNCTRSRCAPPGRCAPRFEPANAFAIWATIFPMDHGGVWRRHGRRHSGNRQSRLRSGEVVICFKAVARRRHHGGHRIPRQSDAGDGPGARLRCP